MMYNFNRRTFITGSASTLALLHLPATVSAAAQCASPYVPSRLTVDCASRKNFALFRQNPDYLGLAAVVSVTAVTGSLGKYPAANLFLFPWLKPKGVQLGTAKAWGALAPTSPTTSTPMNPIPNGAFAGDEYLCRHVLKAPAAAFIGCGVDVPFDGGRARMVQFTNVDQLSDGAPVGINWTSSNLNGPFFGGSRMIPNTADCNGSQWRRLIIDALDQASAAVCAA